MMMMIMDQIRCGHDNLSSISQYVYTFYDAIRHDVEVELDTRSVTASLLRRAKWGGIEHVALGCDPILIHDAIRQNTT